MLMLIMLLLFSDVDWRTAIQITIQPQKKAYTIGEPLAVDVTFANNTDVEIDLRFRYPQKTGITFLYRVHDFNPTGLLPDNSSYCGELYLQPQQSLTLPVPVNRYITLDAPGEYQIAWTLRVIAGRKSDRNEEKWIVESGYVHIDLKKGALDTARIDALFKTLENDEYPSQYAAAELLSWYDHEPTIDRLFAYAKKDNLCGHLFWSLLRHFDVSDARREQIFDLAIAPNVFLKYTEFLKNKGQFIPIATLRSLFSHPSVRSDNIGTYNLLAYAAREKISGLEDIARPLLQSEEKLIRETAQWYLDKIEEK